MCCFIASNSLNITDRDIIAISIIKNFYLHLLDVIGEWGGGLDKTARIKCFLRVFVIMPAKWIKSDTGMRSTSTLNYRSISSLSVDASDN